MKTVFAILTALGLSFTAPTALAAPTQTIQLKVTEQGFEPATIDVKAGTSVKLVVTRTTDATCATAIKIAGKKIKKELPLNKPVEIPLGKLKAGEVRFACGMNMLTGTIIAK